MGFTELWKILDWDEKKSVPEIQMTKLGLKLFHDYKYEEQCCEAIGRRYEHNKNLYDKYSRAKELYNEKRRFHNDDDIYCQCGACYEPMKPELVELSDEDFEKFKSWDWFGKQPYNPKMDPFLFKYYNIRPFEPWVMLNISPDWSGMKMNEQIKRRKKFEKVFTDYLKEEWYSEWKYVFEAGGSGDHLHMHAVCKMGSKNKLLKSCRTHLRHNWKRQILKYAKAEGLEGLIKLPGLQCIIIQGENGAEILKDKIDYLDEAKKPPGHQNKTPNALKGRCGVLIEGSL